jgi:hypothetical protein
MMSSDLKSVLDGLGLSQADFARLVGVTPRAVTLWMVGERAVPGPVEAYAHLLRALTPAQRQVELARLKQRRTAMRDGFYGVEYSSTHGQGTCVLVFDNGRAFGADLWGGKYDGEYLFDEGTKLAELHIKVTFPPNGMSVLGVSHPYEWAIDLTTHLNPLADEGQLTIQTPVGRNIKARYKFLRTLPES